MIRKAIILAAGWGTRRLPITKTIEKAMLPVGNRPLVDYSVQELIRAGVKDIYMVVSDIDRSLVKKYYSENKELTRYLKEHGKEDKIEKTQVLPKDVTIHFISQDAVSGYGTAVPIALAVKEFEINDPVIVFGSDDFIWNPDGESAAEALIKASNNGENSAVLGVEIPKEEVEKYGVFEVAENGDLVKVVEKPKPEEAPSNLINVSKYLMTPELLSRIVKYVDEHYFGPLDQEYVVTDPIDAYIHAGGVMKVAPTNGEYLDGGSTEGWLHANNVVLS